jgi:AcrR family transcriptional regulator
MEERPKQPPERADRILDAAAELFVRLGFAKVTIDDIAQQAQIGKGTVYLHWRSKQQLFEALFVREAIAYVEALLEALRRDPATVLPHRLLSESFLIVSRRAVLRALFAGDAPRMLGQLASSALRSRELLTTERLYALLIRHGLLRADVPHLAETLSAIHSGFYLLEAMDPGRTRLDARARAESLAHVVRHACEPSTPPDPQAIAAAAAEVIAVSEELIPPYRAWVYGDARAPQPG